MTHRIFEQRNEREGGADVQATSLQPPYVVHPVNTHIRSMKRVSGLRKKCLSNVCQTHAMRRTLKKHYTQLVFQLLDLLRQRALRDVEQSRSLTETIRLSHVYKIFQLP